MKTFKHTTTGQILTEKEYVEHLIRGFLAAVTDHVDDYLLEDDSLEDIKEAFHRSFDTYCRNREHIFTEILD